MSFFKFSKLFNNYKTINHKLSNSSKLRLVKSHCHFFWSSRCRRSMQIYNFYRNLYDLGALKEFIKKLRNSLLNRNQKFLLSAAGCLLAFNWDEERITLDETIQEFFSEFERIECLKSQANSECSEKNSPVCNTTTKASNSDYYRLNDLESWEFYVQKNNMITWRRDEGNGHYAYKVYVKYPDITAADFLFVQTDIDYRKEWDDTAVCLEVIDNDSMKGNGSEVVYWEMAWPKLFANRDYVFVRKHFIDFKRNLILIANKSTKHPNCPIKPGLQRVKDYWSFMVIKPTGPTRSFDEPGIEFVLTYFDNPGIRIPKYVTSWVAQHQMPDFIDKLYHATQRFAQKKASTWTCYQDPGYEYPSDVRLDDFEDKLTEEIIDNVNSSGTGADNVQIENLDLESEEASTKPWWNYFRLYNYLH